jgi:RNA-directed DNA polymerase
LRPILSERDLASRLGFPLEDLHRVADDVHAHYRQFPVVKGIKVRIVRPPLAELKLIQKRIKRKILDRIPLNDAAHGGVKGRAPASNAEQHLGQRCVINLDVRQFFDEVHHKMVYRLFCKELGFGRDVARLITRLTTLRDVLPQGAPTSTAIANLFLATPVDRPISNESSRIGIRYTRFVDDMTLSGPNPRPLINVVGKLLSRATDASEEGRISRPIEAQDHVAAEPAGGYRPGRKFELGTKRAARLSGQSSRGNLRVADKRVGWSSPNPPID